MNTCQLTTLRRHVEGDEYSPVVVDGHWRLVATSGAVLIGFRGKPYNFASADNAQAWLDGNILRTANGGASSSAHIERLVKLQSQIRSAELAEEITNVIDRNAGVWSVPKDFFGKKTIYVVGEPGEIGPQGEPGRDGMDGMDGMDGVGGGGYSDVPVNYMDAFRIARGDLYVPGMVTGGAFVATATGLGMTFRPFIQAEDAQISGAAIRVITASSGATAMVGIYANDTSGGLNKPGVLLHSFPQFDMSIAGEVRVALQQAITLQAGVKYWIGHQSSANVNVFVPSASSFPTLSVNFFTTTQALRLVTNNVYANGLPAVAGDTVANGAIQPVIAFIRV